jgi:hypothetical protein
MIKTLLSVILSFVLSLLTKKEKDPVIAIKDQQLEIKDAQLKIIANRESSDTLTSLQHNHF